VDGEPVVSIAGFKDIISKARPGAVLKLEVRRGDKLVPVELTLAELPKRK
jgi:S1-C subfamily serine protease